MPHREHDRAERPRRNLGSQVDAVLLAHFIGVSKRIINYNRADELAQFAYEVGKLERIINIENIELTDPKIEGDEIHVKARCLATTFHTPSAATSAAPASTTGAPATTSTATPPGGK